ncbi:hypothetical protein RFI_01611 [Reticulomyxa filosa]|uniref:CUE domain-containing protein n=1 Tax=Reticulomyxa filosa TaxID=46433 RepID=X6PBB1_RETFI|nr:hypothetical protein RFI_01611 [Reticulomyxa filosa]|eukprot:ETO35451.1 hypothetical protein RFI_01611 [Reticulomyxa filosa]
MLVQLQQTFPKLDEEIISDVLKWFNQDVEETKSVLTWLTENTTNLHQQQYLMQLFKTFDNKLEKTIISQTWRNCNQIFVDTFAKLREICATSNLNKLNTLQNIITVKSEEEKELKITREMCLHILWNILKYPKHIKFRQIHKQALYYYLAKQCHTSGADFKQVFTGMERELQYIGFKKENDDNWHYQYKIPLLHLWNCYRSVVSHQIMYVVNKTNDINI